MPQAVSDLGSNAQENIAHAAKIIGKSEHKKKVFEAIYTGKQRVKTVVELMKSTELPRIRVLDAGKQLAVNRIVEQIKKNGMTAYEKIGFFQNHKSKILSLAASPRKLGAYATKRNPGGSTRISLSIQKARSQARQISIDDIDTFRRAWEIEAKDVLGDRLSESEFKSGLQTIIGDSGQFKDWGGEVSDLWTTRIKLGNKRRSTAVALKGPAKKGKLTPGKMGKNGDQIQRLFEAPATIFLIQYCRQIEQSVLKQMEGLATAKSILTGEAIWYGIIDGQDSTRLVLAYPEAFD